MDELEVRALVKRLARPNGSGGVVIERAAILAAGSDSAVVLAWIMAHAGEPETTGPVASPFGLHGRAHGSATVRSTPSRFVLPAAALAAP